MNDLAATLHRIEAKLDRLLGESAPVVPQAEPERWLEPSLIAYRLDLSQSYVRRLCQRAHLVGDEGVRKDGGRWLATVEAIDRLRRVSGAF